MTRDGFDCYLLYLALQRHFSSSYDFFKYNGKVSATADAYRVRNDYFAFEKLSKIISVEDRVDFFVAHFLENPKEWIRNMSKANFEVYKNKMNGLGNLFRDDLQRMEMEGLKELLQCDQSSIPEIHNKVLNKEINVESAIILDSLFPFIDKHSETVKVAFVFPEHITRLKKYRPFVHQKMTKSPTLFREIAKEVLVK